MRYRVHFLMIPVFALLVLGCTHNSVRIREHMVRVLNLSDSNAERMEQELKQSGYSVKRERHDDKDKGSLLESEGIKDLTFVIQHRGLNEYDIRKVTSIIENMELDGSISLKGTVVAQQYEAFTMAPIIEIQVRIDVTQNAEVYYKESKQRITLEWLEEHKTTTFKYERKKGEEYVDIYIVPDGARPNFKPKNFTRVSLSSPFKSQQLPWDSWHKRLKDKILSLFEKFQRKE